MLRVLVFNALLAVSLCAQSSVICTQPDLADLTRSIGGKLVKVESLTEASDDLHLVRVRPSLLVRARRADMFVQLGLDAEHAWVPGLLRAARNSKIRPGGKGFVNASRTVTPLNIPDSVSRGRGIDLHPGGNPHFNLDPELMRNAAREIRDGLIRIAPDCKTAFDAGFAAWEKELDRRLPIWIKALSPYRGAAFFQHHDSWPYFAKRFGLKIAGQLEPLPGVAPSASHLAKCIKEGRRQKIRLVVSQPAKADSAKKVANGIGARALHLYLSSAAGESYFDYMDRVVQSFAKALAQ